MLGVRHVLHVVTIAPRPFFIAALSICCFDCNINRFSYMHKSMKSLANSLTFRPRGTVRTVTVSGVATAPQRWHTAAATSGGTIVRSTALARIMVRRAQRANAGDQPSSSRETAQRCLTRSDIKCTRQRYAPLFGCGSSRPFLSPTSPFSRPRSPGTCRPTPRAMMPSASLGAILSIT